jgi:IclR family acetate operon transcriptional repressor
MTFKPGMREEVHTSSLGKAILANLRDDQVKTVLDNIQLVPRTPKSIADIKTLLEELERVRQRGYAFDDEESQLGCRCVGAPIFGANNEPLAAISLSGPTSRLPLAKLHAIGKDVRQNALACSALFGHVYRESTGSWTPSVPSEKAKVVV